MSYDLIKNIKVKKHLLKILLLISFMGFAQNTHAQEITVTGSWSLTIGLGDMQGGAGSDFNPTYESAADQINIDIKGKKIADWRVYVSKGDITWDNRMLLYVRITDPGTGPGSLSGGSTYQQITDTDQEFFSGGKNRQNIEVQLQLDGMTVEIPQGIYTTTVYYTVMEI